MLVLFSVEVVCDTTCKVLSCVYWPIMSVWHFTLLLMTHTSNDFFSTLVFCHSLDSDHDRQLDLPQVALHDQVGDADDNDGHLRDTGQDGLQ